MDDDLKVLEQKLGQLIMRCQSLHAENANLKKEMAELRAESDKLKHNMGKASERLTALIAQLPEDGKLL